MGRLGPRRGTCPTIDEQPTVTAGGLLNLSRYLTENLLQRHHLTQHVRARPRRLPSMHRLLADHR